MRDPKPSEIRSALISITGTLINLHGAVRRLTPYDDTPDTKYIEDQLSEASRRLDDLLDLLSEISSS